MEATESISNMTEQMLDHDGKQFSSKPKQSHSHLKAVTDHISEQSFLNCVTKSHTENVLSNVAQPDAYHCLADEKEKRAVLALTASNALDNVQNNSVNVTDVLQEKSDQMDAEISYCPKGRNGCAQ